MTAGRAYNMENLNNYIEQKKAIINRLKSECQLKHGYYPQERERQEDNLEVLRKWNQMLLREAREADTLRRLESRIESDQEMTGHWLMAHLEGNGTVKYFAQEQMDQLKKELQFFRKVI